ncbi:unnamed protein product [Sphagnum tenellum]
MPDVWAATWEFSGAFGTWTKILPGFLPQRGEKSQVGSSISGPACNPRACPMVRKKQDFGRLITGCCRDRSYPIGPHPEHSSGDVFMPRPSIQKRLLGKQESGEATHSKTLHQAWAGNPSS